MADILLIEPSYKSTYPPIGLMKISYFHKKICHDYVRFAKGKLPSEFQFKRWDRVYVSTLFTFEWKVTKEALNYALSVVKENGEVFTGGILATLRPKLINSAFPSVKNIPGLLNHKNTLGLPHEECIDHLPLDYSMLSDVEDVCTYPAHNAYFTYMTRGCGMNCTFCAVKTLEPTYFPYISIKEDIKRIDKEFGAKRDLLLMDNNVLRSPNFDEIIDEIKELGFQKGATFINPKTKNIVQRHVDFNQGLDAYLLTSEKAKRLGELAIKPARIAFDHIEDKEVYIKAIKLCAKNGIDYMSNYLLYNGDDFTGKGHSYRADSPRDLYQRMKITMSLSETLTKQLGRKISIFSFPMRYIPLDALERGYIGKNWNAKFLRALQCMLVPTQGKGVSSRPFFEADFGKTENEFIETLYMPERLISKRGFFVEHKNEDGKKRNKRYKEWSDNQNLIRVWKALFNRVDRKSLLEKIENNRFDDKEISKITNKNLKKLYFLYLTNAGMVRAFYDVDEKDRILLKEFVKEEVPSLYKRMVKYLAKGSAQKKYLKSLLDVFGKELISDIFRAMDIWNMDDKRYSSFISKLENLGYIKNNKFFIELKYLMLFSKVGILSEEDKKKVAWAVNTFDSSILKTILLIHIEEFKNKLFEINKDQRNVDKIAYIIEDQISKFYEQLSFFD
jgi:hypothetical protein